MHLVHRRATLLDLFHHESWIVPAYFPDRGHEEELHDFWMWLTAQGLAISTIVNQVSTGAEEMAVAFSAYVFVSDEFVENLSKGKPWIAGQLCRNRSFILSRSQIAEANATEGLNICVLHHAYPGRALDELPATEIQELMPQLLHHYAAGYRLKSYTKEAFGTRYRDWLVSSGMRIHATTCTGSFLVGISRKEAELMAGARISTMFVTTTPKLGFSTAAQEMLNLALTGQTDEDLATDLGLSLSAIKKRWNAIYNRVDEVAPGIFGPRRDLMSNTRGGEMRRHLLAYLRANPAEVNFIPPRSSI